jgi:methylmalonyl-CoA mutase N-terminal domain/subunit
MSQSSTDTSSSHTSSSVAGPGIDPATGKPSPAAADPHAVTISGIVLDPAYGPGVAGWSAPESLRNVERDLPAPGEFPYTRGLFPESYRTRLWTMRQFAGFGSADDTNRRFKYLLAAAKSGTKANTGLSTAFDLPTLMGRDSDDPLCVGEVGKCGVAIDTLEDMHRLYADIPVGSVTVSQTINGPAAAIWAMYLAHALQRGIGWETLSGTLQNDILKEFHAQNEFIYPPEPSVKLVVDTIEFQTKLVPRWHSVSISGYHIREAGSTATQELAFTLRDGMEYVEACVERGLDVNEFGPRLSFFFNSHNEFFEEICKLRAARRIWARMMRDRYGATNPKAFYMKTHVQTAGCSLTEQQPLNNIVRVAYQAMAGALGGCQSLHTDSMDETLGLPTEQAVMVALRTQQILAHETGVTRVADPLGGSWFVEELTDRMEREAMEYIAEIDEMGSYSESGKVAEWQGGKVVGGEAPLPRSVYGRGVVEGINRGYFRRKIAEASYRFAEECEAKDRIIVGVNEYVDTSEGRPIEILSIPDTVETEQIEQLTKFKAGRNAAAVEAALERIRVTCRDGDPGSGGAAGSSSAGGEAGVRAFPKSAGELGLHETNVMPALVHAALCGCTLGEMTQAMGSIYGRYEGGPEW